MCLQASLKPQPPFMSRPMAQDADAAMRGALVPAAGPGLQNMTGEYNCFLNVIVQCLWHCRPFRSAFMALDHGTVQVRPQQCPAAPLIIVKSGQKSQLSSSCRPASAQFSLLDVYSKS